MNIVGGSNMAKTCKNCGTVVDVNFTNCSNCVAVVEVQAQTQRQMQGGYQQPNYGQQPNYDQQPQIQQVPIGCRVKT